MPCGTLRNIRGGPGRGSRAAGWVIDTPAWGKATTPGGLFGAASLDACSVGHAPIRKRVNTGAIAGAARSSTRGRARVYTRRVVRVGARGEVCARHWIDPSAPMRSPKLGPVLRQISQRTFIAPLWAGRVSDNVCTDDDTNTTRATGGIATLRILRYLVRAGQRESRGVGRTTRAACPPARPGKAGEKWRRRSGKCGSPNHGQSGPARCSALRTDKCES